MIRAAVFAALLPLPLAAQAVDCANAMTQTEMTFCSEQSWIAADAVLNAAYKDAMAEMKSWDADWPAAEQGAASALKAAQRAWVTFRDQACAAEGWSAHGGSMEPMLILDCRARLTRARSADLISLSQGEP